MRSHVFAILAVAAVAAAPLASCKRPSSSLTPKEGRAEGDEPKPGEGERGDKATKPSDLDQPVEKLFAAICEHGKKTHECDECRYETGVGNAVELGDSQLALATAAAQRVQSDFNLSASRAQLLRALGRESPP